MDSCYKLRNTDKGLVHFMHSDKGVMKCRTSSDSITNIFLQHGITHSPIEGAAGCLSLMTESVQHKHSTRLNHVRDLGLNKA